VLNILIGEEAMYLDKLKKRNMLQVFNLVITHGNKQQDFYELAGIRASQDFDGYSCWLAYQDLTISLLFHGSYDFDYKNDKTVEMFFKKITKLLEDK
jgi:hypothetical protein